MRSMINSQQGLWIRFYRYPSSRVWYRSTTLGRISALGIALCKTARSKFGHTFNHFEAYLIFLQRTTLQQVQRLESKFSKSIGEFVVSTHAFLGLDHR